MWYDWETKVKPLQPLIMKPINFNDLVITLVDATLSCHGEDYVLPTHRHPWYEFCYLSEGSYFTNMEGEEFLTKAGSFYIVPPGIYHSHRNNREGDDGYCLRWKLDALHLGPEGARTAFALQLIDVLSTPRPFSIEADAAEFILSLQDKNELDRELALIQFIVWLYSMWKDHEENQRFENDHEKVLVDQALLYLEEYYGSDVSVRDVSRSINVSYRHLARIFKRVTGMTLIEKLNCIRLGKAKNMLQRTDKTVKEIADEVGFKNEYYFSKKFSEHTSITPSRYRSCCSEEQIDNGRNL